MNLDSDAAEVAAALKNLLPEPLCALGIEGARKFARRASSASAPHPAIHSVEARDIGGPRGRLRTRVYRPSDQVGLPILVWYHGGGWTLGSLDTSDSISRALSVQADCVVFSVEYALAPEHKFPEPLDDAYAAIEWVARHAEEIGGDATRLAVGGDSSGGNLAASVALLARDRNGPPLIFQLLVYPVTELDTERQSWIENAHAPLLTANDMIWFWNQYLSSVADRTDPRAVPSLASSHSRLPAAFVVTAQYDVLRDDGESYADTLRRAGVAVTYKCYPGVFHGFFSMVGALNRSAEAIADASEHLRAGFAR